MAFFHIIRGGEIVPFYIGLIKNGEVEIDVPTPSPGAARIRAHSVLASGTRPPVVVRVHEVSVHGTAPHAPTPLFVRAHSVSVFGFKPKPASIFIRMHGVLVHGFEPPTEPVVSKAHTVGPITAIPV